MKEKNVDIYGLLIALITFISNVCFFLFSLFIQFFKRVVNRLNI